jgi:hypothetical protein
VFLLVPLKHLSVSSVEAICLIPTLDYEFWGTKDYILVILCIKQQQSVLHVAWLELGLCDDQ